MSTGANKSSRTIATKKLIIDEYKRRLKDNIRSLSDNFNQIIQNAKVGVVLFVRFKEIGFIDQYG